jgi:predicted DsbA family dithiol-disulfide isomerase/uncharacterized membrane protein
LFLLRAASLVALGTSVALLLDYVRPDPSFCSLGSGCSAVRSSGLGYIPLGFGTLPVPMLGVLAFALLFAATHLRPLATRARVALPLSYAVALGALVFIALQVLIGHFCSLCMTVDVSALLVGLSGHMLRGAGFSEAEADSRSRLSLPFRSWVLLLSIVVGAPLFFPLLVRTSNVPGVIRGMYDDDSITVLEFFDFQCPHCQHLSPRLAELVAEESGFSLKYGYTPLPAHPESRVAARLSICAGEQGKEKEVVSRFFEKLDFSEAALSQMAREIVPDDEKFSACLASGRPDARIESDTKNIKAAGFEGLPTTYVGGIRILGSREDIEYRDAFRRVREGRDTTGLKPWVYWVGVLLLVAATLLMARGRENAGDALS